MALNLSRSTRLFVSTVKSGFTPSNTFEIKVLDGYSFSQDAATQEVALSEAGEAPIRGQKIFNTALNPAEVSITTYLKPYYDTVHKAVEKILWEGLVGAGPIDTNATEGADYFGVDFENSNVHQLLPLQFFFALENSVYHVKDVILNTAEVDFSIDGIGSIAWTGQGLEISQVNSITEYPQTGEFLPVSADSQFITNKLSVMTLASATDSTSAYWTVDYNNSLTAFADTGLSDGTVYTADVAVDGGVAQTVSIDPAVEGVISIDDLIAELNEQIDGANVELSDGDIIITSVSAGVGSSITVTDGGVNPLFGTVTGFVSTGTEVAATGSNKSYNVAITGGSLTIDNGVTFLTPEELGIVNKPIGSFTGTRSITGNVTCYLNTGTNNSGGLLADLVSATEVVTQEFDMVLKIGGNNTPRVEFDMKHAHLVIPAVAVEDVIGLDISFTGLGQDIEFNDELAVRYYATAA